MKLEKVFKYQLRQGLKSLGWTMVWAVALVIVLPFIFVILSGGRQFTVEDFLPFQLLDIVLFVFLMIYSAQTYDGFQLMIQNGIGRKTFFYSRLLTIVTLALGGHILSIIYKLLTRPINVNAEGRILDVFGELYDHFFSNGLLNQLLPFVLLILFTLCFAASFMFAGSFLSLFEKKIQMLIIIGIPVCLILTVIFFGNNQAFISSFSWGGKVIRWIVGENGSSVGHFNPWNPLLSGLIYSGILFGGSYYFNLKLKTPK
ncbi:ABC transporter permease protein [Ligilactobacillus salitolerans]|uniref:ABC transporter permease protein n=1 Tax=Ligilactobacillus salitolerans TaxID=1808352 RepID=A0A401IQ79_9LACO|nr:ABC transporter permease [Ligilactobacillus salitolerans]GBG93670.1 ABC transporter permease protein [Ligilactobacillus salitolerans]